MRHNGLPVSVEVEHRGARDEAVQLCNGRCGECDSTVKVERLRANHVGPSEKRRVEFTLAAEHPGSYNCAMRLVVEPVEFKVFVGPNSV